MKTPTRGIPLMVKIYREVLPAVHRYLNHWKKMAELIPDEELRNQALASIETKTFHCEGGAIYGILAGSKLDESIRFIVAYQTISDYLDNLCDRSTSQDPDDFRALHESMIHALTPGATPVNYYRHRAEQDDGGYLAHLVQACQESLQQVPHYGMIAPTLHELATYYCDLQVHKHVIEEERVPRLKEWFEGFRYDLPDMSWFEFSACSGSTLGIFCLVSYGFQEQFSEGAVKRVRDSYFPYIQGLHILLDYFIDQEEDRLGGDLNFCFYYQSEAELLERFKHFVEKADEHTAGLQDERFHRLINRGLLGIYLSDQKVKNQEVTRRTAKQLLRYGGFISKFFYMNGVLYRKLGR